VVRRRDEGSGQVRLPRTQDPRILRVRGELVRSSDRQVRALHRLRHISQAEGGGQHLFRMGAERRG
jgi:hypothetical protein